jgi:predicted Zn-dependent protease
MLKDPTTKAQRHKFFFKTLCLGVFVVTLLPLAASAHEGLPEQIAAITVKIKRDPKNAALYLQRGELYRLHGKWNRADADYQYALRLQPELSIVNLARGNMLLESRRYPQAKIALDRFLHQQPEHVEAYISRARVLAKLGVRHDAARDYTKALSLTSNPEPELYIERAKVLAGDERYLPDALRGLDDGIERFGPLVTLQLAAIDLEMRRKDYDAALRRLDLITAQSERKETWLVRRGEILNAAGKTEEARAAFNAALVAIESLPPHRRQSRTITTLQLRARAALKL